METDVCMANEAMAGDPFEARLPIVVFMESDRPLGQHPPMDFCGSEYTKL